MKSINIATYCETCVKEYGGYTIQNRALPDLRDGLMPVQRRILWAMYNLNMKHTGGTKKSARVIGDCFVEGTKILTPTGEVNIEDLNINDLVITTKGDRKVIELFHMYEKPLLEINLKNEKQNICTQNQKFKVYEDGKITWKKAIDIKPGDKILCKKED